MAVVDIQAQPFFGNKNRAFWNLQSAGWAGAFILRGASGLANGQPLSFLVPVAISTITGYSVSLLLSVVYRALIDRRPIATWGASVLALLAAALLYAFIDAWVYLTQNQSADQGFTTLLLGAFYVDFVMLAAWSALYYGINFFLRAEEQADQLMMLEAQATSAQLAMLRYQLNPHFLFNTLNSISTLVLLKQTEPANAMLSRLSSFLRYTLASESAALVTLAKEIETLELYLDIEKMRFEERLRAKFSVDPKTVDAILPSLLLQPLVENAIKYAVTPKEEGADISITSRLIGDRVRIVVSDTGPGYQPGQMGQGESTGVGMANTRDRLVQAYGDNHRFETHSRPGSGFEVVIEIPYQTEDDLAAAEKQRQGIAEGMIEA